MNIFISPDSISIGIIIAFLAMVSLLIQTTLATKVSQRAIIGLAFTALFLTGLSLVVAHQTYGGEGYSTYYGYPHSFCQIFNSFDSPTAIRKGLFFDIPGSCIPNLLYTAIDFFFYFSLLYLLYLVSRVIQSKKTNKR